MTLRLRVHGSKLKSIDGRSEYHTHANVRQRGKRERRVGVLKVLGRMLGRSLLIRVIGEALGAYCRVSDCALAVSVVASHIKI